MRDPKRVKRIVEKLEKIWSRFPDWRLGQLLINISSSKWLDLYCMEDEELEEYLDSLSYNNKEVK
jgi:uncharacterized protein YihD (DUF1040 family)